MVLLITPIPKAVQGTHTEPEERLPVPPDRRVPSKKGVPQI